MHSNIQGPQPKKMFSSRTTPSFSTKKGNINTPKTTNVQTKINLNSKHTTNTSPRTPIASQTGSQSNLNTTTTTTHSPSTSSTDILSTSSTPDDNHTPANALASTNTNNKLNYALATANSNTPKREQAIVLHPIDGILLKDYIIAVGQIISPSNIIFVSKISLNRICIFLSSELILKSLLDKTQSTIKINEHDIPIRRLLNPAKRIIISNVCPSIPNQAIIDSLERINISPISEINYLKAGIKESGYEHILSFRRQIYIKHEDISKLPGTLLININETNFRIFFTDDTITCYTCKLTGHTSMNCKQNNENNHNTIHTINLQNITVQQSTLLDDYNPLSAVDKNDILEETVHLEDSFSEQFSKNPIDTTNENLHSSLINSTLINIDSTNHHTQTSDDSSQNIINTDHTQENALNYLTHDQSKRPLSDTSSLIPPSSPISINQPDKKKPKVSSRSNSFVKSEEKNLNITLETTKPFFSSTENKSSITYLQFIYIMENFSNKQINMHTICEDIGTDKPSIVETVEKVRPLIKEKSIKSKLTKLANLLFQILPPPDIK